MSSQRLKHAIHSWHNYWHEHAHHDTRHEETQLGDTTWLPSDALKEYEDKRWSRKKKRSLENAAASGMRGGGLTTEEGSLVRSGMFGSIQYVQIVNMKACILYAQQKQIHWRHRWACFLFSKMILIVGHTWIRQRHKQKENVKSMATHLWHQRQHSSTFFFRGTCHNKVKQQKKWLHIGARI